MAASRSATRMLAEFLGQAFDARSWHGTPLARSLRGVTPRQALWRPAPRRHNIWELLLHTAYWKHEVRRRLTGAAERFPHAGANWPRLPERPDTRALARDVTLLRDEHARLMQTVRHFPPSGLSRRKGQWTPLEQIVGIAAHDLYHCGQIQLLRRLQRR